MLDSFSYFFLNLAWWQEVVVVIAGITMVSVPIIVVAGVISRRREMAPLSQNNDPAHCSPCSRSSRFPYGQIGRRTSQ